MVHRARSEFDLKSKIWTTSLHNAETSQERAPSSALLQVLWVILADLDSRRYRSAAELQGKALSGRRSE